MCGLLLTLSLRKQTINANVVTHESWGSGPLNPYWPAHFPRKCVRVSDGVGDKQRYELVSSGPHVLFGAEQPQSAAVMKSPGADLTLREEVLVYSYLT